MNIDVININILFLSNNSSSIGCTSIPLTDITDVVVSVVLIDELAIEELDPLPLIWRSSARNLASFNSCNLDNLDIVNDGGILRCAARFRASDIEFAFDNELLFLRSDFSFCSGLLLFRRFILGLFCWDAVILELFIILSLSPKKEAVVVVASEGEDVLLVLIFLFNFIATKQKYRVQVRIE